MNVLKKSSAKRYHFIGIGGIGMSGLARILIEKRQLVCGSDLSSNYLTEKLTNLGATIYRGHSSKHISREDVIVYSSGIKESNPEFQAAKALNCTMLHRSELLAELMQGYKALAVTGTHGKTTTSSLLAAILSAAGMDPTYALGGALLGVNGKLGKGAHFVAEADESDGSFLNYHPDGAIVTNIEPEHMDYFRTKERLELAFQTFVGQVKNPQLLFYCGDDPILRKFSRGTSYGKGSDCDLRLKNYEQNGWKSYFDLEFEGKQYSKICLNLVGEHNAFNASAAFGLALRLGIAEETIRSALETFEGIARRCEKRGEQKGALYIDDYAHHPTEVATTLKSVKRAIEESRLIAVFQPHRFTRTQDHLEHFAKAFEYADQVFITDIYPAGENPIPGIDAEKFVEAIKKTSTVPVEVLRSRDQIELHPHDVLISMGAGDICHFHDSLQPVKKYKVGLIFDGLSCEHEISIRSARHVADSLNREFYEVEFFGIDKKGDWIVGEEAEKKLYEQTAIYSENANPIFHPEIGQALSACDLFLPILHGPYGEDGTIQGFFEMIGKPYVGPDHRAAAIAMDKVMTKKLVALSGIKTPKDISFGYFEWLENRESFLKKIEKDLRFPLYVKPVHMGSSVGIRYIESMEQLEDAIDNAFRFDPHVMVEEGLVDCRELEFAVVGNLSGHKITAPPPGEKLSGGSFVDYEKKYGSQAIPSSAETNLAPEIIERGRELACKAFRAIGCNGMTRVDFLLDREGEYWLFEMNPIPGLHKLSLFPKIWKHQSVEPGQLFDRLVVLALHKRREQDRHYSRISIKL